MTMRFEDDHKINRFMDMSNTIISMKNSFHLAMANLAWSKANIIDSYRIIGSELREFKEFWDYTYKGIIRNYINTFEYACLLYNDKMIDSELFAKIYKNEIISLYENNFGKEAGIDFENIKDDTYEQIIKTYNEFKGEKTE